MRISELIKQLQEALENEGDLEVCAWPYDGQGRMFDAVMKVEECTDGTKIIEFDGK